MVGERNSDDVKELLSLERKHGFNFTQEDLVEIQDKGKTSLSPKELLEVFGGKVG